MKKTFLLITLTIVALVRAQSMQDILNIPGPIVFHEQEYFLHWSKANSKVYFTQNFLPRDQHIDTFENLIAFNYFNADIDIEMAVRQKIESVQKLREKDKSVTLNMMQSPDNSEYIVEYSFTISPETTPPFLEYNLYKFSKLKSEKKPLLITTYTRRFYTNLKEARKTIVKEKDMMMTEIANFNPPDIKLISK